MSSTSSNKVFVIIVTFNGIKWVDRCFSSLGKSTIPLQTLVIDNGSTDKTVEMIESQYPEVKIIRAENNLGFGKANNIGLESAYQHDAEYVFLLNQDAWIEPDTVNKLIQGHRLHPEYSIISPMHLNGNGDELEYGFSNFIAPNKCEGLYSDIYFNKVKEIYDAPFINAAAWLMTRECLEKIGGFSPSFFHYGEDDNYTDRLQFHGAKLGVLPAARICHDRERGRSPKFFENGEVYRRELIQRASNPNLQFSFSRELLSVLAHLAFAILCMNFQSISLEIRKCRLLNAIDKGSVIKNRDRSKQYTSTFLNLKK